MKDGCSLIGLAVCLIALSLHGSSVDTTFHPNPGTDGMVEDIIPLPNGKVLISGAFTKVDNETHYYITRLNANGTVDSSFTAGANNWVRCMALQADGKILIGGKFTSVNGYRRERIARLNADGTVDTSFDPGEGVQGPFYPTVEGDIPFVWGIVPQPDGKILICGGFLLYQGAARSCIARLNSDATLDTTFDVGAGAYKWVKSIYLLSDGKVMIAGWFENYDNQPYPRIARILSNGKIDPSFGAIKWGDLSSVYTLAFQADGKIMACGHFSFVNDTAHEKMVRFNVDGTVDQTFNASANDFVEDIKVRPDGKILAGGYFSSINDVPRSRVALLNTDGSVDPTLAPQVDEFVWMMRLQGNDKLLIGGSFYSVDGIPLSRIARLNMSTSDPPPLNLSSGTVYYQNTAGQIGAASLLETNLPFAKISRGIPSLGGWRIFGADDFNHDQNSDLLWLNYDGRAAFWYMDGTNVLQTAAMHKARSLRFGMGFVGAGDFDGNGSLDLTWQGPRQRIEFWLLNGTNYLRCVTITNSTAVKIGARAFAVSDFNGDGKPDIIWQNGEDLNLWLMDGTNVISTATIEHPNIKLSDWTGFAAMDLNNDSQTDLLFRKAGGQLLGLIVNHLVGTNTVMYRNDQITRGNWRIVAAKH